MAEPAPLPDAYRRLLWAYPGWYRRERADEILTTLLDAAPAGRLRFNFRDALDLVIAGIRCRLRLPKGGAVRVVATISALFLGVAASAVAGLAIWRALPSTPTRAQAVAVAQTALPLQPASEMVLYDDPLDLNYGNGDLGSAALPPGADPSTQRAVLNYRAAPEAVPALMDQARDRLEGAGWVMADRRGGAYVETKDESATAQGYFSTFWAMKHDLIVQVNGVGGPIGDAPAIQVSVHRQASSWVTAGSAAAMVIGGLAGWLLTGWIVRAYLRHGTWGKLAILLGALPGLLAASLLTFMTVAACLWLALIQGWDAQDSLAPAATVSAAPVLTAAALASTATCALVAAFAPRRRQSALPAHPYTG